MGRPVCLPAGKGGNFGRCIIWASPPKTILNNMAFLLPKSACLYEIRALITIAITGTK
jgi:hypothetical protein